ncbi:MAG TPA: indole-3-glycerol phosphate synthase TrpC [Acidimicrobiales bacterium]|jgi:indole-3-glycerol phosphate synthase
MSTYLDRILASHRAAAAADDRDLAELMAAAREAPVAVRPFAAALAAASHRLGEGSGVAVIAEIKRRSPSKGDFGVDLVADVMAKAYADGGAAGLSVLTDRDFFGGSAEDLAVARRASGLPVLRKDFTVCEADVCDARLMGADAVLLIVAALSRSDLRRLAGLAGELGLDALFEVHDEPELDAAIGAGAVLVGVNQRDLVTFEVDTRRAERVVTAMPLEVVRVAESGITGPGDARRLADAGFDAVLVGESLVRSSDPRDAVAALRTA